MEENPQYTDNRPNFLRRTIGGAVLGFGAGLVALIFISNPLLLLLGGALAGGFLGGASAVFSKKEDVEAQPAYDEQQQARESAQGQGMAPELAQSPQMEQTVSPSATKEHLALAQVAEKLNVQYNPNDVDLPPLPKAEQLRMEAVVLPTEQEQSNLAVLSAYSRGESVSDDEALAAYRNIRQEVSRPLLEEGLKMGAKMGMQRAGVAGYSADISAETLAKPMAHRLSNIVGTGVVEKYLARDPVLQVAQACVNHIFPERAQKIDGRAMELDLARTIGHFSSFAQQPALAR